MTIVPRTTVLAASLAAGTLAIGAIVHVRAARAAEAPGHVDTIANVAAAGRASVALIEPAQLAMNDALSVMRRLASDTTVQKALLAYSQKQDVASATGYLQRLAPNSVVTVQQLTDFLLGLVFTVRGHVVGVCASDDGGCSGHDVRITVN